MAYQVTIYVPCGFDTWIHTLEMDLWCGLSGCKLGMHLVVANGISQCLAKVRKLGDRRSSEGLHRFNPSNRTNLICSSSCLGTLKQTQVPVFSVAYAESTVRHRSKAVLLMWFLTVTCSCCPFLYFGSAIMLVTYFSKF